MYASTAVGTVRTYAHISETLHSVTPPGWMPCAVLRPSSLTARCWRCALTASRWAAALPWRKRRYTRCHLGSCIGDYPMTRVELVVNGEIRESQPANAWRLQVVGG